VGDSFGDSFGVSFGVSWSLMAGFGRVDGLVMF
jgi:hypothetical protein